MSSKLDHSLDEILASSRNSNRRGNKSGPVGGIRKRSTRAAAQKANANVAAASATRNAPKGPAAQTGKISATATKIIVSNLPLDVTEQMIKEYFASVVGPIQKAVITYGPNGQSRGIATVEFKKPEHAALAAQKYNGVDVDKRPMKVELVIDPNAPASFADRVGPPKSVPKPVTNKQPKAAQPKPAVRPTAARGGRGGKRGGRAGSGRGKPKTAEELDQEMSDYFSSAKPAAAAAPAATNGGDVGMEDTEL